MRLLLVHADRVAFEATREADPAAESAPPSSADVEDCLGAFAAAESGDGADPAAAGRAGADAVRTAADRLNADRIAVVPCGHLVDPEVRAEATVAAEALDALSTALPGRTVTRAPVGWDLALEVRSRGHPHAVSTHRVGPGRDGDTAESGREWYLLAPGGDPQRLPGAAVDRPSLRVVVDREVRERRQRGEAIHDRSLSATGLAERSPVSPGDEPRLYPRGTVVRDAILELVVDGFAARDAMPVETATTLDLDEAWVRDSLTDTPPRVAGGGATALRPSARPGHRRLLEDLAPASGAFPVRVAEVGPSFSGTDAATVPELSVACRDPAMAREEFERAVAFALESTAALGLDVEATLAAPRSLLDERPGWLDGVVETVGHSVALAVGDETGVGLRLFAVADARATPLSTVSLSPAGVDADGTDRPVVHCAPVGAIPAALVAVAAAGARRERPVLPTWLSPTQVRLLPVADDHCDRCDRIAAELAGADVRVDVDGRDLPVAERIDRVDREWVPYYAVVGDGDDGDSLSVTVRASGRERRLSATGLGEAIADDVGDRPSVGFPLPRRIGRRPAFGGDRDAGR